MGIAYKFSTAFAMAQIASGQKLPVSGTVFLSLNDLTKPHLARIARAFKGLGFKIVSTFGTARVLELEGIKVERVLKMHEGHPHAGDMFANGQIQLILITSSSDAPDQIDGRKLRRMALACKVPIITTVAGALATAEAIQSLKSSAIKMVALQDFFDDEGINIHRLTRDGRPFEELPDRAIRDLPNILEPPTTSDSHKLATVSGRFHFPRLQPAQVCTPSPAKNSRTTPSISIILQPGSFLTPCVFILLLAFATSSHLPSEA